MPKRKSLYYGSKTDPDSPIARQAVSQRGSKAARPWNHPDVVQASQTYGVPFNSYKQVHKYENTIQDMGSLEDSERFTCRECGKLNSEHEEHM
jgi:hypothetical protein